jgi:hypothetical protein
MQSIQPVPPTVLRLSDHGALLAINLLYLTIWGCAGIEKLRTGVPSWFEDKFGQTFLAKFPGLTATFWLLTVSEVAALALGLAALCRLEFLSRKPLFLTLMLTWSLIVFTQLSLGVWITSDYNATPQMFAYFAGTLLALTYLRSIHPPETM